MTANSNFFGSRSPQAVLKHGILTRYAYYFAGRAGAATANKVAYIDGYAGEGRYEDGTPGSPLLLAAEAQRVQLIQRDVKLAFVEPDPTRRAKLRASLNENGVPVDQVDGRPFDSVVGDLLDRYHDRAVFMFVDPFGLGITYGTLVGILRRRSRGQPIDVLYHFSLLTTARMGRNAIANSKGSVANAGQMDIALGPVDWRDVFQRVDTKAVTATQAATEVARRFGDAVERETGVKSTAIEVRQHPSHEPKYLLMLFSADRKAHWAFADVASTAHEDFLLHLDTAEYDAYVEGNAAIGRQELFATPPPTAADVARTVSQAAASYFKSHLPELFRRSPGVVPIDAIEDVYGLMLGRARSTHLRAAVKLLHREGLVDDDGIKEFETRPIRWTGPGE